MRLCALSPETVFIIMRSSRIGAQSAAAWITPLAWNFVPTSEPSTLIVKDHCPWGLNHLEDFFHDIQLKMSGRSGDSRE
jgi:hypothetical protein